MKTLGLESCRSGWIAICLDEKDAGYWLLESHGELAGYFDRYDRIFIDVPIGMAESDYERECDRLLRKQLGPVYHDSIYNPPIRPALHAPTYAEASMISYETNGNKVPIQSWNIVPYIRAVDTLLQNNEAYREKVFETHPELLFQKLNGGSSILQKKETKKGLRHRLGLIKEQSRYADDFFRDIKEEYRRNQVDEDDIVDAMVMALYARRSTDEGVRSLPSEPDRDVTGLPMAYHYA